MGRISIFIASLILVFCSLVSASHAQQFVFELSPGLKFFGSSFQKNTSTISQGSNNIYGFEKIKNSYSYENFEIRNRFGLEPEFSLAFFEFNKKWKLNFGLTTFLIISTISAKTSGYPYSPFAEANTVYTEYISKQLITNYQQFSLNATRTFKTNTKIDKYVLNKISLGFGFNRPSVFNTRNEKEFYATYLYDSFGYEKNITFKKSAIWGLLTPILNFKYELVFQSNKHANGLFTLFVNYVQGFSNQYTFSLTSHSIGGSSMDIRAKNNGSGIRFGISKTFKFTKIKKHEIN